jgi:hypothetical protein
VGVDSGSHSPASSTLMSVSLVDSIRPNSSSAQGFDIPSKSAVEFIGMVINCKLLKQS